MPSGIRGKCQFVCLNCKTQKDWSFSSTGKYCGHTCQWEYRYRNITVPLILEGKISPKKTKDPVVRFITERDGYKCLTCNLTDWLGKKMILDIDHIDGDNENNYPSNWRFLCPNCHRLTPTWGNKKRNSPLSSMVEHCVDIADTEVRFL
jgi:5-methylcytosine-specific restriction endonuclease McrA